MECFLIVRFSVIELYLLFYASVLACLNKQIQNDVQWQTSTKISALPFPGSFSRTRFKSCLILHGIAASSFALVGISDLLIRIDRPAVVTDQWMVASLPVQDGFECELVDCNGMQQLEWEVRLEQANLTAGSLNFIDRSFPVLLFENSSINSCSYNVGEMES